MILAGGAARRLGGVDKPALRVGGRALLDRVLDACRGAGRTVVVGPRRPTVRPVRWAREEPPGGGPVAAVDAGVRQTTAPLVLVLSADLPFLTPETVRALLDGIEGAGGGQGTEDVQATGGSQASEGTDATVGIHATGGVQGAGGVQGTGGVQGIEGTVLIDSDGREQPLVAAYRAEPLRREIALLATEHGGLGGLPLRLLVSELALARLQHPTASFDCDTWEDITTARARIREHGHVLDEWIAAVKAELGIDLDVDTAALLDLARDAAHGVARPAAPLTTFLVGYAAAQKGGGPEELAAATEKAAALAARWAEEQ
ncbi:molybdopterin-guanine dinucleotide biosynthesis protein [Streptomyces malaysiensis]|uniref:Molybdopterin-guanine dinucleotide biosynthesis protein n=1 Tax=Streptomyces malaysiensis TaxID=92644 RepID=A0A7X5X579_STRMQ|nr:molybdopterin-guanine dinucleotide biosynthesis protein [Streptomyces malaysiensis]